MELQSNPIQCKQEEEGEEGEEEEEASQPLASSLPPGCPALLPRYPDPDPDPVLPLLRMSITSSSPPFSFRLFLPI